MSGKGTSRNVPCPCGSGRKFKNCHGRVGRRRPVSPLLIVSVLLLSLLVLIAAVGLRNTAQEQPKSAVPRTTQYASIPGLQLELLPATEQAQLLTHLNHTQCLCDCNMTVAECRHLDPDCEHSKEAVEASFSQLVSQHDPLSQVPVTPAH